MASRAAAAGPVVAALPLAAALTLLGLQALPLHFAYRGNDLGIVSASTRLAYPLQQETFYWLAGLGVGTFLSWALARALAGGPQAGSAAVRLEAVTAATLVGVVWLPPAGGWAVAVLGLAAALRAARRSSPAPPPPLAAPARRSVAGRAAWLLVTVVLALLLAPGLWGHVWNLVQDVPDELLVHDTFKFLAEAGQHLAWADALRRGELHGRDFFCLYGPLYDLGLVGLWAGVGRSIAAWSVYVSLGRALAWVALLLLAGALVRRRAMALLCVFLLPWINLRVGLALFGLLFLSRALRGAPLWGLAAGFAGGVSLLYSQEYGAAFLAAAGVALALRADARTALAALAGLAAAVLPLAGYYAAEGALVPMLRDLAEYPGYVLAGFGKLPFPGFAGSLMGEALAAGRQESLVLRLGLAIPAACLAGLLLALPVSALAARRPLASLAELRRGLSSDPGRLALVAVALFGLASFRSALGRSDLNHVLAVAPAAALLLVAGSDRLLDLWQRGERPLAAWRAVALAAFALQAGFVQAAEPASLAAQSLENLSLLLRRVPLPAGDPELIRVVRFVQRRTDPGEPVLFLPNDAALYYLADRPSPIRFVLGHQMVTDAHRAEALADLEARPPRYLVWNHGALRVDDLPDEAVFGPALLDWLEAHYRTEARIGEVEILRLGDAPAP